MNVVLKTAEKDNVVTCLRDISKGEEILIEGNLIMARGDIPQFHKMAVKTIQKGFPVYKYGQIIGLATEEIVAGEYAHIHNVESTRGRGDKK